MAMVWPCELSVEKYAVAGREAAVPRCACPICEAAMAFRGWYTRSVRDADLEVHTVWVRRAWCSACGVGHSLLPSFCLLGRLDAVDVIGRAIRAVVVDQAVVTPPVMVDAGVPATTVRSWVGRHRRRAQELLVGLLEGAVPEDRSTGTELAALAIVVGLAWVLSVSLGVPLWSAVSVLTGGMWLSASMDPRWEDAARTRLMIPMAHLEPP